VIDALGDGPTDVLRPRDPLWDRLAARVADDIGRAPVQPTTSDWREPAWDDVAPGIECKLLASAPDRVTMLVRLAPGAEYPPHRHAGVEELHLLDGELWIDERRLQPGDYSRAEPGTADQRVWSETGCTCVLVTSPRDVLG
jgi:anti-sigma factor ChrR (cupin superfamily)